jgi:protein gp37
MAENSKIEWTTHTFNPWWGCTKVSEGCKFCYAETLSNRYGKNQWGPKGNRTRTSAANWRQPLKWNRDAYMCPRCGVDNAEHGTTGFTQEGPHDKHTCYYPNHYGWCYPNPPTLVKIRPRVFCASMADVFEDRPELAPWRLDLFDLIHRTPNLDWLLLTKRPENVMPMISRAAQDSLGDCKAGQQPDIYWQLSGWYSSTLPSFRNVWIGTSVENQDTADKRIPELLKIPAAVRFLSVEPLLGPINLLGNDEGLVWPWCEARAEGHGVDWVIVGGESGSDARPMHPMWVRSIRDQCTGAGVPFFFKQWGEWSNIDRLGVQVELADLAPNQCVTNGCVKGYHTLYTKVGKHKAGRVLDGRTWDQFPEPCR